MMVLKKNVFFLKCKRIVLKKLSLEMKGIYNIADCFALSWLVMDTSAIEMDAFSRI